MLKITLHDGAGELRFRLEGKLAGPWVGELRQCWQTAASASAGRKTVVDLHELDFVDPEGELLLAEMHRSGARLLAATPLMHALVKGIVRSSQCGTVEGKSASRSDAFVCPDTHGRDPSTL